VSKNKAVASGESGSPNELLVGVKEIRFSPKNNNPANNAVAF